MSPFASASSAAENHCRRRWLGTGGWSRSATLATRPYLDLFVVAQALAFLALLLFALNCLFVGFFFAAQALAFSLWLLWPRFCFCFFGGGPKFWLDGPRRRDAPSQPPPASLALESKQQGPSLLGASPPQGGCAWRHGGAVFKASVGTPNQQVQLTFLQISTRKWVRNPQLGQVPTHCCSLQSAQWPWEKRHVLFDLVVFKGETRPKKTKPPTGGGYSSARESTFRDLSTLSRPSRFGSVYQMGVGQN